MRLNLYKIKRLLGWVVTNSQSLRWITQGVVLKRLWAGRVDATKRCLDVGCGGGTYAIEHFLARGAHTTLCDYEASLVELARRQVGESGLGARAEILQASAYALPFENATFDCIACIEVLEHLEDPVSALREIFRVAKPGAMMLASTPHPPEWYDNPSHVVEGYTCGGLTTLIEQGGWKVERTEVCILLLSRIVFTIRSILRVPLPLNLLVAVENLVPVPWRKYLLPYDVIALARRPE